MSLDPSPAAWRALPKAQRHVIARAAWHNETAILPAHARAAVEYGRFVRTWAAIAGVVVAAATVVAAALAWSTGTIGIVLGAGAAMLAVIALATLWARLLIRNNSDAAARNYPSEAPESVRVGPGWPWTAFAARLAFFGELIGLQIALHHYGLAAAAAAVLVADLFIGPMSVRPLSVTVDGDGITFPACRARVPWTSVHDAWADGSRSVTVRITGPYQPIGRLPKSWRRQIDKRLRGDVKIASRRPELVLSVAEANRLGQTPHKRNQAQPVSNNG